ncbi:S8 family peptidase [Paenibacillus sp. GCM10012307]
MAAGTMDQILSTLSLDVVRRIKRHTETMRTLGANTNEATDIVIANLAPDRAELLQRTVPPHLMIVEDKPLSFNRTVELASIGSISPTAEVTTRKYRFRVIGLGEKPLPKVTIQLAGDAFPAQKITDESGEAELELVTLGSRPPRLIIVTAPDSYWDIYLSNPQLNAESINIIRMRSLSETIPQFPDQFKCGWGQRMMGLEQIPKEINGSGIKIAIIDSGCDNEHPLLKHIQLGQDFSGDSQSSGWNSDQIGHGTHCAGIIAARSVDGGKMRGFAPEAEIHVLKIFPGGSYSSLIEALDYCVEHGIDVINMSLGGDSEINPVVEQSLAAAAQKGIVCIVAAGNSGDAVKYPASSQHTFAVAAIGNLSELQPNTWDSTTVQQNFLDANGLFSPNFSCFGPQISVCAPGVSIVSTVPGGAYKAESGTSMAAPHITGLAALLLAHHPLFQSQYKAKDTQRVIALFNMIRSICIPLAFDNNRTGAGLPGLIPTLSTLLGSIASTTNADQTAPFGITPPIVAFSNANNLAAAPIQGQASFYLEPNLRMQNWFAPGPIAGSFIVPASLAADGLTRAQFIKH